MHKFITKGKGKGRKVIPMGAKAEVPVKVKVKTDPKLQFLKDIKKRGIITELELRLMFRRFNDGIYSSDQVDRLIGAGGIKLTSEQNRKGYGYLIDQWKTPRGIERKNNPFGYRETDILDNFKQIKLVSTYNIGVYRPEYIPVYNVISKDRQIFQYIWIEGAVRVIG